MLMPSDKAGQGSPQVRVKVGGTDEATKVIVQPIQKGAHGVGTQSSRDKLCKRKAELLERGDRNGLCKAD